jgi:hypothetical protein
MCPITDIPLPTRMYERKLMLEAKFTKSKTDMADPMRE